jgi:hypothetical protein
MPSSFIARLITPTAIVVPVNNVVSIIVVVVSGPA